MEDEIALFAQASATVNRDNWPQGLSTSGEGAHIFMVLGVPKHEEMLVELADEFIGQSYLVVGAYGTSTQRY